MVNVIEEHRKNPGLAHKCPGCGEMECRDVGSEYGELAGGGDYDVHLCSACGKRHYVVLAD